MSSLSKSLCLSLVCSTTVLLSDALPLDFISEPTSEFPSLQTLPATSKEGFSPFAMEDPVRLSPVEKRKETTFRPFTGKIKGKKVRMRLKPDLDSSVIKELSKNELLSVIGESGDFWAVLPTQEVKAYVFRSFVLDNVVEGNRVNVRLEPNLDAPVIAHLSAGERLENTIIAPSNNKWLEIAPPAETHFYVAKEYVEYAGGPELKVENDRRMATGKQLLDAAAVLSQAELKRSFEEIDFDRIVHQYGSVINDYSDLPDLIEKAKEALLAFQESYLEKRIAFLETRPLVAQSATQESKNSLIQELSEALSSVTDKMRMWEPIEEALYSSWASVNNNRDRAEFYENQKLLGTVISGLVEPYHSPVKNKPGDFILRDKEIPVGYIYSTHVNLQSLVGKRVSFLASPRANHNFAFPAYYILAIE